MLVVGMEPPAVPAMTGAVCPASAVRAAALLRLAGQVLIEQHDEWDGADREQSKMPLNIEAKEVAIPGLAAA